MTKQLKKLSFAKEELVNLNEYEMSNIKGGEENWTTVIRVSLKVTKTLTETFSVYTISKEASMWNCPGEDEQTKDDNIEALELSEIYDKEDEACIGVLPPIIVKG